MGAMAVELPDSMLKAIGMTVEDVRREFFASLYIQEKIDLEKALRLTGSDRDAFEKTVELRRPKDHLEEVRRRRAERAATAAREAEGDEDGAGVE